MDSGLFSQKKARVLLIEPAATSRNLMSEAVKELGFRCEAVATIQDGYNLLQIEPFDWIITSLFARETINALQILRLSSRVPELLHLHMSLLIDESEMFCLRTAFELGLLSYHTKPLNKETLGASLGNLIENMERDGWNTCLTAARALRELLAKDGLNASILSLEKNIVSLFPRNADALMNLAQAHFVVGDKTAGTSSLHQALLVDPSVLDRVKDLATKFLGEASEFSTNVTPSTSGQTTEQPKLNLGLGMCVFIESDEQVMRQLLDIFGSIGVQEIKTFSDGLAAWDYINANPEPSILIHEWKIPKLAAPILIQRIRQKGYHRVPILVTSSLLKEEDMPLVKEVGVAKVIPKPFSRQQMVAALVWIMQQDKVPTEAASMERKIRQLLSVGDKAAAETMKREYVKNPEISPPRKKAIEAEFSYFDENYFGASELALEALKGGESIFVLNLLGRCLMKLREFESALKCLEKAQSLSPMNIERLCAIAEVQTELGDTKSADETLEKAENIDADNIVIMETEAKVALAKGDAATAREVMRGLESFDSIVSFLNNKAISLTRCGRVDEGIKYYLNALDAIPSERKDIKAIVHYNLALAYARDGAFAEAKGQLEQSIVDVATRVEERAKSLKERIETALLSGTTKKFRFPEPEPVTVEESPAADPTPKKLEEESPAGTAAKVLTTLEIRRGEKCCYMVFDDPAPKDQQSLDLIAALPRFSPRAAIKREQETLGVDKLRRAQEKKKR